MDRKEERKAAKEWQVAMTSVMFRFTVGAVGISPPKPMRTGICGPFWLGLAGCTFLLPLVILGWTLRLFFGQRRVKSFFTMLNETMSRFVDSRAGAIIGKIFVVLAVLFFAGLVLFLLGAFIYEYGWLLVVLTISVIAILILAVVGLALFAYGLQKKLEARREVKREERRNIFERTGTLPPARPTKVGTFLSGSWDIIRKACGILVWFPRKAVVRVWELFAFVGQMVWAAFKHFCPIGEI